MSQAMAGIPKAPEHKARIAAAQRRRHAAARVLTAVEAFHRSCEADAAPGICTLTHPVLPQFGYHTVSITV